MRLIMPTFGRLFVALLLLVSTPLFAHARLLASSPADHAQLSPAPASLRLVFSEKLMSQLSSVRLTMTQMPGMAMGPTAIDGKFALMADGKTLVFTPAHPLGAGTYRVDWHVVSADTHVSQGTLSFIVK